jgi:hypothetical protein
MIIRMMPTPVTDAVTAMARSVSASESKQNVSCIVIVEKRQLTVMNMCMQKLCHSDCSER